MNDLERHYLNSEDPAYRERRAERERERRKKVKAQRSRDLEKVKAQSVIYTALRNGSLIRQPCEICGESPVGADGRSLIHAHHDDYSQPLEVRWLCALHHGHAHREEHLETAVSC